jgi:DNA-binding XRE family transcriptional regulator
MTPHIEGDMTPAKRRRLRWGQNLDTQMKANGFKVKQLHRALLEHDVDVSTQAIYSWLKGETAPRPETQAVIAEVLRTRAHLLFPAEAA